MFCGKCGSQVEDGAKFCNKCGNSFVEETGAPASMGAPSPMGAPAPNASFQANPQPTYTQSAYSQPTYSQPGQSQPGYSQPSFPPQPAYGTPQGNVATAPAPKSKPKFSPKLLIIGAGAVVLLVIVLVLALGGSGSKNDLVGTWVSDEGYEMIFEKDGTMKIGALGFYITGEYSVKGKRLTIVFWGETSSSDFKISGNKLTIIDDDGTTDTLTRKK